MTTKILGRLSLLAVSALLASCGPREGARLELSVGSEDQQVIQQTQRILYARLSDSVGSLLGDVRTAYFPGLRKLVFEITAGAPAANTLRYLYETRGEYRVFATDESGETVDWITNRDIVAADGGKGSNGPTVFLGLGADATRRVGEISAEHIGATIQSSLDGQLIFEKTVTWPIGRFYQFEVEDIEQARLLAIVLRHGALPVEVTDYAVPDAPLQQVKGVAGSKSRFDSPHPAAPSSN